jgi:two-component system OmpR family sensor kinase
MGRLFWKLFLLIGLPQLGAMFLVGIFYAMHIHDRFEREGNHRPPPYLQGAPGGERPFAQGDHQGPPPPGDHPPPDFDDHAPLLVPPPPLIGGVLATIVSSAWLAWLLTRPVRHLRQAFITAASGDLTVRVGNKIGAGRDELHDLGMEFDRMVERLDALVSGQRRLLHDVSHELRSPLARMQAAIGLAGQQPDQARAAMERIDRESVRMNRLIGELLALARLQAGFTGAMDEEIEIRELMSVIVDDARFEAKTKGRTVHVEGGEVEATVRGNVELLRRAIENIVRNALKYSFENGEVRIATRTRSDRPVVVISVADAGPGVPEPDLEAIFEPFFRGLASSDQEGHGLGLAIARRVVLTHGGKITASNVATGGLRVEIELPLVAAG